MSQQLRPVPVGELHPAGCGHRQRLLRSPRDRHPLGLGDRPTMPKVRAFAFGVSTYDRAAAFRQYAPPGRLRQAAAACGAGPENPDCMWHQGGPAVLRAMRPRNPLAPSLQPCHWPRRSAMVRGGSEGVRTAGSDHALVDDRRADRALARPASLQARAAAAGSGLARWASWPRWAARRRTRPPRACGCCRAARSADENSPRWRSSPTVRAASNQMTKTAPFMICSLELLPRPGRFAPVMLGS